MRRNLILVIVLKFLFVVCLPGACPQQLFANDSIYTLHSVLASGNWKKVKIEKNGIYKITYDELKKMGFSDPMKVSICGYGGWPLEEDFMKLYIDDLPRVSIWRGEDYLLFYGKGSCKWEYSASEKRFVHTKNPYSTYGCYFITDGLETKEMEQVPLREKNSLLQVTSFDEFILHETEQVSPNKSGRDLFGESLSGLSTNITIRGVDGMTDDEGKVVCRYIERTFSDNTISVWIEEKEAGKGFVPVITSLDNHLEYLKAKPGFITGMWPGEKNSKINVQLNSNKPLSSSAYLDYLYLQGKRTLKTYKEPYTFFRSLSSVGNATQFLIQNADTNTLVFDVTDGLNVKVLDTKQEGSNLSFNIPAGFLREFVLVHINMDFPSLSIENVPVQNLHGISQPEMVIISPSAFKEEAERLAIAHRDNDGLSVEVVTAEEIYNEFSSGTPDATAYRRFMKMFYDRSIANVGVAPRYLLLFGDGAYDNRFLSKDWEKYPEYDRKNLLLTYQTTESLNAYSYVADDYFGLLDDQEDVFHYQGDGPISNGEIDLGIGRFPIRTEAQAKQMVDKVLSYMHNSQPGLWKNSLCFLADDGNGSDDYSLRHATLADKMARKIENSRPEYIINKVYFDSYEKMGSGIRFPDVRRILERKFKEGLLVLNYVGHGGTEALSDDNVLTHNDILQSKYTNLPLWITVTCDFCRFDDIQTSAGEDVFLHEKSGGIGLLTTSRVAFVDLNEFINDKFMHYLLEEDGYKNNRLGDVIKKTKRAVGGDGRKLGFCLIGDPALRLSYPESHVRITEINGRQVGDSVVQFKALDKVTISGEIVDDSGYLINDFAGELTAQVFDGKVNLTTRGNNYGQKFSYDDYVNLVYKGSASVSGGRFSFSFIVPKDISYSTANKGKISLIAFNEMTKQEAQGYYNNFVVGGTVENSEEDTEAPEIRTLYLNDSTFIDGGKVNTTPCLYVRLWDKSGINITGNSPGHDITLYIDDNPVYNYNLNAFYENDPDKEGEGEVSFPIPKLKPGLHYAEFKVWDIMNNVHMDTIHFEVVEGLKPFIYNLTATPSPAREHVQFRFSHNRPESKMDVEIAVYDMAGRLQWKHSEKGTSDLFEDYTITWDLNNSSGTKLRSGIYLYRAMISTENSKEATDARKMIILY